MRGKGSSWDSGDRGIGDRGNIGSREGGGGRKERRGSPISKKGSRK